MKITVARNTGGNEMQNAGRRVYTVLSQRTKKSPFRY